MSAEKVFSSQDLEKLLLRRRRQEAVERLRALPPYPQKEALPEGPASDAAGPLRPSVSASIDRLAASRTLREHIVELPFSTADPVASWTRRGRATLRSLRGNRRRPHPAIEAFKRGLGRVIDGLVVLVLVLFILTLAVWVYDTYLLPRLNPPDTATSTGSTWAGLGYLSPPAEEIPQAPLPFVAYTSTISLENTYVPIPTPAPGTLRPTRLVIPRIQLDTPVVEVTIENGVWQVAEYAAGYHRGTARPGTVGNMVISGHKGLKGAVFRRLEELSPGDEVLVYAGPYLYRYIVEGSEKVWPYQVEVMAQTATPILTLITCTTYDTQRLVVVATLDREVPTDQQSGP